MSGIIGLFHKDDVPVDTDTLKKMAAAMDFWGPDGSRIWNSGPLGLGHLLLHSTPEAKYENLPRISDKGQLVITVAARIDNREELANQLSIPASERPRLPDSEFILRAYKRWDTECPRHLIGDWSFAIWDSRKKRLLLARDQLGITSLFYFESPRFFAFASSKSALLKLPQLAVKLNEPRFAQSLVRWLGDPEQTEHQGIMRLLPGHIIIVSAEQSLRRQYWSFKDISPIRMKSEADYVEGLMEVYRKAVRCRLRCPKPVGLMLSGGLDSGSVAVIAADILRSGNQHFHAFGSVPAYQDFGPAPYRTTDETPNIKAIAEAAGNIELHLLKSKQISPVGSITEFLNFYNGPQISPINHYWILDIIQTASSSGLGAILTGQMGNGTVSWSGLASSQSLRTLLFNRQWLRAIKYKLIRPLLPHGIIQRLSRGRRSQGSNSWKQYSIISDDFAQRINLSAQMESKRYDPTLMRYKNLSALETRSLIIWVSAVYNDIWASVRSQSGLEVRDPTGDLRVVEYCFGIPDHIYSGPGGKDRLLIRRAMKPYLPHNVLWNCRKGLQAADIIPRLQSFAVDVDHSLEYLKSLTGVKAYMDIGRLETWWSDIKKSDPGYGDYSRAHWFMFGLSCGLFFGKYFGDM